MRVYVLYFIRVCVENACIVRVYACVYVRVGGIYARVSLRVYINLILSSRYRLHFLMYITSINCGHSDQRPGMLKRGPFS